MLLRDISNWSDPGKLPGLLFLAQRLDELTFDYTLDSYRAPTTNAPFLVRECITALSVHKKNGALLNSALHILDEAEVRLRNNIIVGDLLDVRLERYLGIDRNNLKDMERRLRVLRKEIDPHVYILKAVELAKELSQSKQKENLDFLAREIVTTIQNLGVSTQHINATVCEVFFGEESVEGSDHLDQFFRDVFPHNHTFVVCLKIDTLIASVVKKEILDIFKLSFSKHAPKSLDTTGAPASFLDLESKERFVVATEIRAPDKHSAMQMAKEKIARIHDLFGLFHHKGSYRLDDIGLVQQKCCADITQSVRAAANRMHFVNDNKPKDAAMKLERMIKGLKLPGGADREKFFRVIDFHGMSAQSDVVENQLLNLWTALETIVPNRGPKTIISNVVNGVLPFVGLRYFRRLLETLTFDIVRWDRMRRDRRVLGSVLNSVTTPEDGDLVDKVFCMVAIKENEPALSELLARLENFELLKFRLFELNKAFCSPKRALKMLEEHQRRVEWQLHRIYRTRNAIVHSGRTPTFTDKLVANAHDYFDQVFDLSSRFCSGPKGFDNYSDCFDYAGWLFEQYQNDLGELPAFTPDDCSLVLWRPRAIPRKSQFFPGISDENE